MEETTIQILDHWFTIGGSSIVVVLTIIMIILMFRDRKKKIAIDELKKQTQNLEGLYQKATEPRIVKTGHSGYFALDSHILYYLEIVNSDIFSIETQTENKYYETTINLSESDYLAQNSEFTMSIVIKQKTGIPQSISISYKNNLGIKYKQEITILPQAGIKFRPLQNIE